MKTAIVTGANRGIGKGIAENLSEKGYKVYRGTRNRELHGRSVEGSPAESIWIYLDVSNSESIVEAATWYQENESQLDLLVNNAGVNNHGGFGLDVISRAQMNEAFGTNVFGVLETSQSLLESLRRSKDARIINVSSSYGQLDGMSANLPSYCLSKMALNGLTIMMANTWRGSNIAVNAVCPGWVRTDMGGPSASSSIEEAASGIVWLATEEDHSHSGKFYRDRKEIDW